MFKIYDLVIVGAGPAGLASEVYAKRRRVDSLILEASNQAGGMLASVYPDKEIDDYPGFPTPIKGADLACLMYQHARNMDLNIKFNQCVQGFVIKKSERLHSVIVSTV